MQVSSVRDCATSGEIFNDLMEGECEVERSALAHLRFDPDTPAAALDDAGTNCKAHAGARYFSAEAFEDTEDL
jgi:hypothetical protein